VNAGLIGEIDFREMGEERVPLQAAGFAVILTARRAARIVDVHPIDGETLRVIARVGVQFTPRTIVGFDVNNGMGLASNAARVSVGFEEPGNRKSGKLRHVADSLCCRCHAHNLARTF
jgi:hypothetical protein